MTVDKYEDLRMMYFVQRTIVVKRAPTDSELAILGVLWNRGPCTVRQVHQALNKGSEAAYTTTLKLMQIMHDKGLVLRDSSRRSHVYTPAISESQVQGSLVADLMDKAFGGSTSKLVMRALSSKQTSPEELEEIRGMLDAMEEGDV